MMRVSVPIIAGCALTIAASASAQKAATKSVSDSKTVTAPRFEVDMLWPKPMPDRWILGSVTGLAVDSRDHIFVLNVPDYFTARTEIGLSTNPPTGECCAVAPAVLEFDPAGNVVGHWGGPGNGYDWPTQPRGLAIDKNGNIWIGGSGGNDTRLLEFTRDGKFITAIGKSVSPAAAGPVGNTDTAYAGTSRASAPAAGRGGRGRGRGGPPALPPNSAGMDAFGGAANIALDPSGTQLIVADGYRNRRVAIVDPSSGSITKIWGANGKAPTDANDGSQFGTPVACAVPSKDGMIYVCDRANDRIQVFRKDGSFVTEKTVAESTRGGGSVWDVAFSADPQQKYLYVADGMNQKIWILDRKTLETIANFGDGGRQPGQFYGVTNIATDSKGNLYTGEFFEGKRVQKFNFKGVGPTKASLLTVWPSKGGR
jgi:DNA-binding beta-propeller fold protein YncE